MEVEDSDDWWNLAQTDLDSAKIIYEQEIYYVAAFLCHQALEKGLKSVIILTKGELVKTHILRDLAIMVDAPDDVVYQFRSIDPAITETRYTVKPVRFHDREKCNSLLELTEDLMLWIRKKRESSRSSEDM